jgi:hypothetical protein
LKGSRKYDTETRYIQIMTSNPEVNFAATLLDISSLASAVALRAKEVLSKAADRVGVVWSGLTLAANDANRNITRVATTVTAPVRWTDPATNVTTFVGAATVFFLWDAASDQLPPIACPPAFGARLV